MRADRIARPAPPPVIPERSYHKHESCKHWCAGYGCREDEDCRKCRNQAFNARQASQ